MKQSIQRAIEEIDIAIGKCGGLFKVGVDLCLRLPLVAVEDVLTGVTRRAAAAEAVHQFDGGHDATLKVRHGDCGDRHAGRQDRHVTEILESEIRHVGFIRCLDHQGRRLHALVEHAPDGSVPLLLERIDLVTETPQPVNGEVRPFAVGEQDERLGHGIVHAPTGVEESLFVVTSVLGNDVVRHLAVELLHITVDDADDRKTGSYKQIVVLHLFHKAFPIVVGRLGVGGFLDRLDRDVPIPFRSFLHRLPVEFGDGHFTFESDDFLT